MHLFFQIFQDCFDTTTLLFKADNRGSGSQKVFWKFDDHSKCVLIQQNRANDLLYGALTFLYLDQPRHQREKLTQLKLDRQ